MNVVIVSVDHNFQLVEASNDSSELRTQKHGLRELLQRLLTENEVKAIFEESSVQKATIAAQVAYTLGRRIIWSNINMTDEERHAAGILEALANRPHRLVWGNGPMPDLIGYRIPVDSIRENFFIRRVLEWQSSGNEHLLVLLGNMHVLHVADKLRLMGHTVVVLDELLPAIYGTTEQEAS